MRHGITICDRDKNEMLGFFDRGIADGPPPSWIEWRVRDTNNTNTDDVENAESSAASESEDEEYQAFMHLRQNPDGKRCRCGSTTHLTINSHACPLNPRNRVDNGHENDNAGDNVDCRAENADAGNNEGARAENADASTNNNGRAENTDAGNNEGDRAENADATSNNSGRVENADAANNDSGRAENADASNNNEGGRAENADTSTEEEDLTLSQMLDTLPPKAKRPRRSGRRRLGLSARGRRLISNNACAPLPAVGTAVQSPGTRWNLPANTNFKGVVVAVKKRNGAPSYEVQWEDGVVEYMQEKHILPMCGGR